jgi:hypothetical protein
MAGKGRELRIQRIKAHTTSSKAKARIEKRSRFMVLECGA